MSSSTDEKSLRRSFGQRIRIAAAVILLCAAAVEGAGALLYFWNTGGLVYAKHAAEPGPKPAQQSEKYRLHFHPYFGFAGQYNLRDGRMSTNGAGFLQPGGLQIPYKPSAHDYVVVVFGGSVAARAALGFEGGEPLVDALRALPEFSTRRPVVINMAQGSGKQPQQLLELAYLLAINQHIDLALNIDGFNEFALGQLNVDVGISPVLPSWAIMSAIAKELYPTPESADYYGIAYRVLAARKSVASHLRIASAERTGASYAWHMVLAARAKATLATATAEYETLIKSDPSNTKDRLGLDLPPNNKADPMENIYSLWLKCSQQMRALAAVNGFKYLHVIQPNQQFSKHQFSENERKIALNLPPNHPYVAGTKKGYLLLAQRADQLSRNGIVSLVDLFDNVHEEVYGDRCCHFNQRGETLFAKAVAREVAATLDR